MSTTKTHREFRRVLLTSAALTMLAIPVAQAASGPLPSGGSFVAGTGSISIAGSAMTVNQSSARGIITWDSFNVAKGASVQINNGLGATLNRVAGGDMSVIAGQLQSTGSIYLINPHGVVIGPSGQVLAAGGFVASTRDVSNSDFMSGNSLTMAGASDGQVVNDGQIVTADGNVVLVGHAVSNNGQIHAANGEVTLAAANKVLLSSDNSGVRVVADILPAGDVANRGNITAAAALLTSAGGNVYALAGNAGGLVQATGTQTIQGRVFLTAPDGQVTVGGHVTAQSRDGSGGTVQVNGSSVTVESTAQIGADGAAGSGGSVLIGTSAPGGADLATRTLIEDGAHISATGKGGHGYVETSGRSAKIGRAHVDAGVGGTWLVDPTDLTIDSAAASSISAALDAGTNVTETTSVSGATGSGTTTPGLGDIVVAAPISWSGAGTLKLDAYHDVIINAPINITGAAGGLVIKTGDASSSSFNALGGSVSFSKNSSTLNINGSSYILVDTYSDLLSMNVGAKYALMHDMDFSSLGALDHSPLGDFTGSFEGLGHTISGVNVVNGGYGLFSTVAGTVNNLHVAGAYDISNNSGNYSIGGIAGNIGLDPNGNGGLSNSTFSGTIHVSGGTPEVGGLVANNNASIRNSSSFGVITLDNNSDGTVGGIVGTNNASITRVYSSSSINVNNGSVGLLGGLVGSNQQSLSDSYYNGLITVAGGASVANFGGLAGYSDTGTSISASFSLARYNIDSNALLLNFDPFSNGGSAVTGGYFESSTAYRNSSSVASGITGTQWTTNGPSADGSYDPSIWDFRNSYPILRGFPTAVISRTDVRTYGNMSPTSSVVSTPNGVDTTNLTWTVATSANTDVGSYAIFGSGAIAGTNQVAYAGVETVNPATITVALRKATKTYDGTTTITLPSISFVFTGIIDGDSLSTSGIGVFSSPDVGRNLAVSVTGLALSGPSASNYHLASTSINASVGVINPATITTTLQGTATKTYDGTSTITLTGANFASSGRVGTDDVSVVANTATLASVDVGSAINVTASGLTLSGAKAGNYQLISTSVTGSIGAVTPALLSASLQGTASKTYDGTRSIALTGANFSFTGKVGSDDVSLTTPTTGTLASVDAGTGINVTAAVGL
ncbi:beta strand repeat-containing protein, partial [Nitrospirillum amazonense]|uniref:beta strand repeat-containing protein n=1 Tax=Nitrospirillum amazonense TaxID=28077 RepID=UPI0024127F5D